MWLRLTREGVLWTQLRKQLEKALSRHCELMAHVKKAAEEDAARRAEGEHLERQAKSIVCPVNAVDARWSSLVRACWGWMRARALGMRIGRGLMEGSWPRR